MSIMSGETDVQRVGEFICKKDIYYATCIRSGLVAPHISFDEKTFLKGKRYIFYKIISKNVYVSELHNNYGFGLSQFTAGVDDFRDILKKGFICVG